MIMNIRKLTRQSRKYIGQHNIAIFRKPIHTMYFQGMSEKMSKQVEAQISDLNSQLDETTRTISELQSSKMRLQNESAELTRQLEEAESNANALNRERSNLNTQLEDARRNLDDETRVRTS